jgi:hypothetical protein
MMNFTYEQVMDMGFPTTTEAGRYSINRWDFMQMIDDKLWPVVMDEPASCNSSSKFLPLPTVEEVYATLRSGLFLKYNHSAKDGLVFQFKLSDHGFGEQFYASGRDLCEAVCNAYLRSKHSPANPWPNQPKK